MHPCRVCQWDREQELHSRYNCEYRYLLLEIDYMVHQLNAIRWHSGLLDRQIDHDLEIHRLHPMTQERMEYTSRMYGSVRIVRSAARSSTLGQVCSVLSTTVIREQA